MFLPTILTFTSLLATSFISASPISLTPRQAGTSSSQSVVYWGQGRQERDLSAYCEPSSGIDIVVLAFIYQWGNGQTIPSGIIGPTCYISPQGQPQNCEALISSIKKCQSNGIKVILSLGGAVGSYSLSSVSEAEEIGQNLWDVYGNPAQKTSPRPFGDDIFVNGWDFDIEHNLGSSQYYSPLIKKLRSNFASDPSHTYYITGAPQCPIPEPNMGIIIESAKFDYLFVQFYNNNNYTVPCALPFNGNAPFNYNNWTSFISTTESKDAKLFIGVPASKLASNGNESGATYYITPEQLAQLVGEYKSKTDFGGVMMWDAAQSDANVVDGCTYAQQAKSILVNGRPCGGGSGPGTGTGPSTTITTSTTTSSTASTPISSSTTVTVPQPSRTGTVEHWGQVSTSNYTPLK